MASDYEAGFKVNSLADGSRRRVLMTIPTYRRPALLCRAIESALAAATETVDIKVVVVDNASPENPAPLLNRFGDKVKLIRNEHNIGMTGNWNRCWDIARASDVDFIMMLEDDNLLEVDFFSIAISALETHPEAKYFHCATTQFDECGNESIWYPWSAGSKNPKSGIISRQDMLGWAFTAQAKMSAVLLRRDPHLGRLPYFNSEHFWCHDVSGLCELAVKARVGYYSDHPSMRYYLNPSSVTSSVGKNRDLFYGELFRALKSNMVLLLHEGSFSSEEWICAAKTVPAGSLLVATLALHGKLSPEENILRSLLQSASVERASEMPWKAFWGSRFMGKAFWAISAHWAAGKTKLFRERPETADYHSDNAVS